MRKLSVFLWYNGEWCYFGKWTQDEYRAIERQHPTEVFDALAW
jgi:hypothetical protein